MTDPEAVKTFQHVDGEIAYFFEYTKEKESLCIRIINKLLCEEYSDVFDNSSNIFNDHSIIKKPFILFNIFVDNFEKDDEHIEISFETSNGTVTDNVISGKKYTIKINLNLNYISDTMELKLPYIDKHITPQQVIERIDYRFDEYIPTVEKKITKMKETIEKLKTDKIKPIKEYAKECFENTTIEIDTLKTKFNELRKVCDELLEHDTEMSKQNKILNDTMKAHYDEFTQFIDMSTMFMNTETCMNAKTMIVQNSSNMWYVNGTPMRDFTFKKIKYFKNLVTFELSSDTVSENLLFLAITPSLKNITLTNCSGLTSIEYLTKFPNLETITISGVCKIKDLHTLADCPKLTTLKLPTGTNTGCFPKTTNFEIKMI